MEIGFCGTGRMGAAMVERLLDGGHMLVVWNRSTDKLAPLAARGAAVAATPRDVAARVDLVITMLTDAAALAAVYDGPDGLLAGAVAGKLFVDMSTLRPDAIRALAGRVGAKRAGLVECPVGGTVGPAREGKLLGFAGGAAADFARAKPVLAELCRRVEHVGPNGAGASMKLAINLPLALYWEGLGEALSLCADAGIDAKLMLELFQDSSGGANALKTRASKIMTAIEGGQADVGFDIDGMRKDVRSMIDEAAALGVELPLATRVLDSYEAAATAGLGGQDASSLSAWRFRQAKARRS
ncbi:MAG TPA: NAD(P)-dependent oxidoreductase [Candidatus Sulfotelmatobacter sp.]|nr:NAD(P)-dependent oxidoreductase [Candidatus Sulfotelmatobacter sp.]